jgi:anti-sigma B factor antagonist
MHVTVRKAEDVVIVNLTGQLHCGLDDEILRSVMNELLSEGWRKILLNLSKVHSIDTAGVGELVQSLSICRKFGADLKLLNPHDRVKKSLHLAQLLPVFHVYEDEAEALRGFQAAAAPGR